MKLFYYPTQSLLTKTAVSKLNQIMNQRLGFLSILLTAVILGTFGILVRELSVSFSDSGQVLIRSVFASLIIILVLLYKKASPLNLSRKNWLLIILFSIVFPTSILFFTYSVNTIKVTNSFFLLYAGSLGSTALLDKIIFREKFTAKHFLSLFLAFLGLLLFVYPFEISILSLGLFGFLAGALEGTAHTLRRLMKDISRDTIVFYQSLSGAILAGGVALFSSESIIRETSLYGFFVAFIFGVFLVSIGYLLAYGFANVSTNLGVITLASELLFATLLSALILLEYPTLPELIGGILIFSGTIISGLELKKPVQRENN